MTGEGRIPAGDFRAIVDVAAARGRFEPIDRAAGGLIDWPSGNAPTPTAPTFISSWRTSTVPSGWRSWRTRRRGACRSSAAAPSRRCSDDRRGELWRDFRADREKAGLPHERDRRARDAADPSRLHGHRAARGRQRIDLLRRGECARLSRADGTAARRRAAADRLARRRQPDLGPRRVDRLRSAAARPIGRALLRSLRGAHGRRTGAPADAAMPAPAIPICRRTAAGSSAPCRRPAAARSRCSTSRLPRRRAPAVLVDDPDADFTGPRWSPDGRQIVAARRRAGVYELVLIDPGTGASVCWLRAATRAW